MTVVQTTGPILSEIVKIVILTRNSVIIETDVVIIGSGISGALVRYYLLNAGIECTMIDSRTIGLGSTSASTSLLQYEIDTPLHKLIEMVGKEKAERSYQLCDYAIQELEKIVKYILILF